MSLYGFGLHYGLRGRLRRAGTGRRDRSDPFFDPRCGICEGWDVYAHPTRARTAFVRVGASWASMKTRSSCPADRWPTLARRSSPDGYSDRLPPPKRAGTAGGGFAAMSADRRRMALGAIGDVIPEAGRRPPRADTGAETPGVKGYGRASGASVPAPLPSRGSWNGTRTARHRATPAPQNDGHIPTTESRKEAYLEIRIPV